MNHAPIQNPTPIEHLTIPTNGVHLHVVAAGPQDGPVVILLHGFPEFWCGWRYQIPALAAAGFRVLVPDQRGTNTSDKPAGLDAYRLDTLADDVGGLIDWTGRDRVFLIGHDWGAAVAWWVALRCPERLHSLIILNVPHPVIMLGMLKANPRQMLKSWYIGFFQIPALPEVMLGLGGGYGMANALLAASGEGSLNDTDIAQYLNAWAQPGALTGMLNWYRAIARRSPAMPADPRIRVPTRILWGDRDIALVPELADASAALCDDVSVTHFPAASHFVQHDDPEAVNAAILEYLNEE